MAASQLRVRLLPVSRNRGGIVGVNAFVIRCRAFPVALALSLGVVCAGAAMAAGLHSATALRAGAGCKVTVPSARTRPPKWVPRSFEYGNGSIAVAALPLDGQLVAGRLASGGQRATIEADGSIRAKFGWWRDGHAKPVITGLRLDAHAAPLRAHVPDGYGSGFQATALTFPTTGCWRVTGRFGRAHLTFTLLVKKSRLGP
jgi:hypothetical protein